jgi:ABC-2 type transport system permease protein
MRSIYFKELNAFLSSLSGYVVLLVFIIAAGLFLWVLPDTNILDYGYASMEQFFRLVPWLLLFLIPAITMKSFADEFSRGTMEWLFTKPLTLTQIISGKFLASLSLVIISLLPTLIYLFSVQWLSLDAAVLDFGGIAGAYIGLLLLASAFTAIGIFCSSITENQIISFLVALFVSLLFYSGFEAFSRIATFRGGADYYLAMLGMDFHFDGLARGLLDSRDILYFLSLTFLFIALTRFSLQNRTKKR